MLLATTNLLGGRGDPADLDRFLRAARPDVLCAQEVGPDAGRILERHFPYGRIEPAFGAMGGALVSVHPVEVDRVDLPFRGGFTTVLPSSTDLDGVRVLGIHLANPIDPFTSAPVRRRQLNALEPWLHGSEALVVAGDMNATPIWPAYRRLSRVLDDLVADWSEGSGRPPPRTWARRPGGRTLLRIDHVFGRGMEATDVRAERLIGVDHLALLAELRRR